MDDIENFERGDTLYKIIGCAETSTKEQITEEYHQRVKNCHPDKHPDNPVAEEEFKSLQKAYAVLSDETMRRSYDKWLSTGLAVSFETWQNMTKKGHGAVHFGRSAGTKLQIDKSCDVPEKSSSSDNTGDCSNSVDDVGKEE